MSIDNLKKFMELVKTDKQVAQKAAEIGHRNITGLMAYGQELKLEFNEKDFEELQKKAPGGDQALSDAELGKVSGGVIEIV